MDQGRIAVAVKEAVEAYGDDVASDLLRTMDAAVAHEAAVRSGFEERLAQAWSPALDRLNALIIAASEAGDVFIRERRASHRYGLLDEGLARVHARSCLIAREILTLLHAGYASGAHARWRSLHELAVTAFFIAERGPAVAEAYLLHAAVMDWRAVKSQRVHAAALGEPPVTAADEADARGTFEALIRRYGRPYGGDWGWAAQALGRKRLTFADLEEAVDLEHLRPFIQLASHPVHGGSKGSYFDLGAEASRGRIFLAGASNTGLSEPGQGAAISLMHTTIALLSSDMTAERVVIARAIVGFTDATLDAFIRCDAEMERRVSIRHGFASRRRVFARRRGEKAIKTPRRWRRLTLQDGLG